MKIHYKFISEKPSDFEYNPKKELYSFYQICQFRNEQSRKYEVRKVIFNEHGVILKAYEKGYPKFRLDKFMEKTKLHKYKMYPVSSIKLVSLPDPNNIFSVRSELLN
jgi:hypothetical protein